MVHFTSYFIFYQCNRFFTKISRLCTFSFFFYPAMKTTYAFFCRIAFISLLTIVGSKTLKMFGAVHNHT